MLIFYGIAHLKDSYLIIGNIGEILEGKLVARCGAN
jgi:hypothetical protein